MYIRVYPFATSLALCLNSLLIYSPTIRGGSDTSSIYFSSGKDVASLNRSDVSASAETRHQKCTRMPLVISETQMYPSSAFANRRYRYEARAQINRRHAQECASLHILGLQVCRSKLASAWNHGHPCPF